MRAIVVDSAAPSGLALREVPDPEPGPGDVLVAVHAFALNFGDVHVAVHGMLDGGHVPGYEAAGVVVRAAADGSGPPVGARVATFDFTGAWAELRAVPVAEVGLLPAGVGFDVASTLPAAGVSALRALRRVGPLLGRTLLITGAAGGVGRFAVQLGAAAGARVIACVGSAARGEGLRELGAAAVVVGLDGLGDASVDAVVELVGGSLLAEAFALLADGGVLMSVGSASMEPTTFAPLATVSDPRRRLETFMAGAAMGADVAYLAELLDAGTLRAEIGWAGGWQAIDAAVDALRGRTVRGKAVLRVR